MELIPVANQDYVERMNDILSMLRNVENSGYIAEAESASAPEKSDADRDTEPQAEIDNEVEDLMTKPKSSAEQDLDAETVGDDLGIDDAAALKSAMDLLRGGVAPSDPTMITTLANTFIALLHANASTTQRSINRLRKIYKTPLPGAD